jgi:hypothetical protein
MQGACARRKNFLQQGGPCIVVGVLSGSISFATMKRFLRFLLLLPLWILAIGCALWAAGALWFDLPWAGMGPPVAAGFLLATALMAFRFRRMWLRLGSILLAFGIVLLWWRTLQPSQDREWQPDVDRTAWAEVHGDEVVFHNVRNFDYRSATDYTPRWETRTVRISQLTGIDMAINYWGSPWMAHPIVSFQFADAPPLCFSIETRREVGESYSAIGGFYRRFELVYIVADERDVLRVRTNYRKGEDVYLYRTRAPLEKVRERFFDYVKAANYVHSRPVWYNAITTNCTTTIRIQHSPSERPPFDWRMLLNGKGDEMLFERGALVSDGLAFPALKAQARINDAAQEADADPAFSERIRRGRAGF